MNLVVIVIDSLRQDHVGAYHHGQSVFDDVAACATPNLDRFAAESVVFDNVYADAYPTVPIRYQLMTGHRTLPNRAWGPLNSQDVTIAEMLRREGYVNGIIGDNFHYASPGMNYHRGFNSYEWIRGQEYDAYEAAPPRRNVDDYVNDNYPKEWRQRVAHCLANMNDVEREDDYFAAQVVDRGIRWLRRNREHAKLFLWIDIFDPHEPWDPPKRFDTYTDPAYTGKRLIMPMGGLAEKWATPEEIRQIRGLYAGEASFTDYSLGRMFDTMRELGYYDDTAILVMADHGHPLADHGKFLKGPDRMYNELFKIPFMVRLPGGRNGGRRARAIAQYQDVVPTLLDVLGYGNNLSAIPGDTFRSVVEGERDEHRDCIITGFHEGADRCIRDHRWSLVLRPGDEPDELYDLPADPRERVNLIDQHPDEARRLAGAFGSQFFRRARATALKGLVERYELSAGTLD